jgi:Circularly permutated YpsA SLOG family
MTASKANAGANFHGLVRIVSGGQTGVDRAALDAAITVGIQHGGWCPKGRRSEDGKIPAKYQVRETESSDYAQRTERNVLESDGTLILYRLRLQRGTLLTSQLAIRHVKPVLRIRLDRPISIDRIVKWINNHAIKVMNVAGPRASSHPEIHQQAYDALIKLFQATPALPSISSTDTTS